MIDCGKFRQVVAGRWRTSLVVWKGIILEIRYVFVQMLGEILELLHILIPIAPTQLSSYQPHAPLHMQNIKYYKAEIFLLYWSSG